MKSIIVAISALVLANVSTAAFAKSESREAASGSLSRAEAPVRDPNVAIKIETGYISSSNIASDIRGD